MKDYKIKIRRRGFADWPWVITYVERDWPRELARGGAVSSRRALKKARAAVPLDVEISV